MFLTIKLCTHAKKKCLKWKCLFDKMDRLLNNLQTLIYHKNPTYQPINDLFNNGILNIYCCS